MFPLICLFIQMSRFKCIWWIFTERYIYHISSYKTLPRIIPSFLTDVGLRRTCAYYRTSACAMCVRKCVRKGIWNYGCDVRVCGLFSGVQSAIPIFTCSFTFSHTLLHTFITCDQLGHFLLLLLSLKLGCWRSYNAAAARAIQSIFRRSNRSAFRGLIEVRCGSACRSIIEVRVCVRHTVKSHATQRLISNNAHTWHTFM